MKITSKRIMSLLVAALLVMSLFIPAFSVLAANGTGTITVSTPNAGETYSFYKVLDLTWRNGKDGVEGTADDVYSYTVVAAYDNFFKNVLEISGWGTTIKTANDKARAVASYFDGIEDDADALYVFSREIKKYAETNDIDPDYVITATNTKNNVFSKSGVEYGYYVMVPTDEAGTLDRGSIFSLNTVTPNTVIQDKTYNPTLVKKIKEGSSYVDANSAAIGDTVTYRLTSAVPKMNGYESYKFTITDTLASGLKFAENFAKSNVTITIGGATYNNYTVSVSNNQNGTSTLTIDFVNFISYANKANDSIVIEYAATVDTDAVIGTTGNANDAYLTFSNDPAHSVTNDMSTDDTIVDEVKTYVAGFSFTKVDKDGDPIDGAIFRLSGANLNSVNVTNGTAAKETVNLNSAKEYTFTTDSTGHVLFEGLKEGVYLLTEVRAPYGFIGLNEPITITITCSEPTEVVYGSNTPCTFTASDNTVTSTESGVVSSLSGQTTGIMSFNVVNQTQSRLPATGSNGILYFVIPGAFILFAGAILLTKKSKKMNKNNA